MTDITDKPAYRRRADTTWLIGTLPAETIIVDGVTITGPFCAHCGWWYDAHDPGDVCILPPSPLTPSELSP